jgi:23S rRNA (guanine1835-N2)-methyltransferase
MQNLKRYPVRQHELLQAWDSADELLLQHLNSIDLTDKKILIVNDQFGALSCGLKQWDITVLTDSFVSFQGIKLNSQNQISPLTSFVELKRMYDYVLIQMPKNLSYLEDLLCHLTHHLHDKSQVIIGVMLKHLPPTSFDLIQKYIGSTSTSLAQKKARLIFATFQKGKVDSPYPLKVQLDGFEKTFINHSNLFSREKLDIGTRFFLEHIPLGHFPVILDLGCANGVVGIKAKMLMPNSHMIFSDESAMAIESARINFQNYFSDGATFIWDNCFESGEKNSVDLVLCNPPFHQSTTVGDFVAWQMFMDSKKALKKGGVIRVIGNSHLGYQFKLKKIFGNSKIIASNKKFMIIDAMKMD